MMPTLPARARRPLVLASLLAALPATAAAHTGDDPVWGGFRGANGNGVATGGTIPAALNPEENLMWRVDAPDGFSSPTVTEQTLYVTGSEGNELYTMALDRFTGEVLWKRTVEFDGKRPGRINSPASPSPVTDGDHVFSLFHPHGIVAYDKKGKELWSRVIGPFNIPHGMSTSPVLHGDLVLLQIDQDKTPYLVAYEKKSGKQRWKVDRPGVTHSYATPTVYVPEEGPAQVIVSGSFQIAAYAVETGEKIWWIDGAAWQSKAVPVVAGDRCYINSSMAATHEIGLPRLRGSFEDILAQRDKNGNGVIDRSEWADHDFMQQVWFIFDLNDDDTLDADDWAYAVKSGSETGGLFAIDLTGKGDVSESHVAWKRTERRGLPDIPSPILIGSTLFLVKEGGLVTTLDAASGELKKQARVGDPDAYFASPVAAGGRVLFSSKSGILTVTTDDAEFSELSSHSLDEDLWATPAVAGNQVFVRTTEAVYCFENLEE